MPSNGWKGATAVESAWVSDSVGSLNTQAPKVIGPRMDGVELVWTLG